MAKTQKEAGEVFESLPLPEAVTFIDQEYTRRTLVLPDWLVLEVVQGQVTLAGDDAPGLAYMRNRPDFKEA
ncbi:hypothetical protein C4K38_3575 [Pseudomonas chlororaphis subsp. piscium]|uniref:hypothetical protein n=1 Tax=Pseudomonas chlororaphis TaxID=587753 RepID=UPI0006A5EE6C|nr:hypothetical protein [Pseudomonas chlororaphis]AZC31534.1 hypothetical protein C4K38_3575 [Pseudomonas chlororaphis subsp. piscium]WDG89324.1 hypothetical protein PUP49_18645 [Pseudomonas chlororaphis]SDS89463.1 hypothetical protein SAMN05216585_3810 [Pseudomonas chlororaphis]